MNESQRWIRQAEADLQTASDSAVSDHFDAACFYSQQAAEKALKALIYGRGHKPGQDHIVLNLLKKAEKHVTELSNLRAESEFLDKFYVSSRYPDALDSDMAPADYFDQRTFQADAFQNDAFQTEAVDAKKCVSCAESILNAVKTYL